MSEQQSAEKDTPRAGLEEACLDGLVSTPHGYRYRPAKGADAVAWHVIDGMTAPPGGPDDPFWQGAQWAYGEVRKALGEGDQ